LNFGIGVFDYSETRTAHLLQGGGTSHVQPTLEDDMGIGDMLGKAASVLGGGGGDDFDIMGKLGELGIDPSALTGMGVDEAKSMLADKGLDLSMLEGLGLDVDDIIGKLTGG